jgi:hypothetical protein
MPKVFAHTTGIFQQLTKRNSMNKQRLFSLTIVTLLATLVTGCDNGAPSASSPRASNAQTRITGHVLDDEGPITQGKVEAKDAQGVVAARAELKDQSAYVLTLCTGQNS